MQYIKSTDLWFHEVSERIYNFILIYYIIHLPSQSTVRGGRIKFSSKNWDSQDRKRHVGFHLPCTLPASGWQKPLYHLRRGGLDCSTTTCPGEILQTTVPAGWKCLPLAHIELGQQFGPTKKKKCSRSAVSSFVVSCLRPNTTDVLETDSVLWECMSLAASSSASWSHLSQIIWCAFCSDPADSVAPINSERLRSFGLGARIKLKSARRRSCGIVHGRNSKRTVHKDPYMKALLNLLKQSYPRKELCQRGLRRFFSLSDSLSIQECLRWAFGLKQGALLLHSSNTSRIKLLMSSKIQERRCANYHGDNRVQ